MNTDNLFLDEELYKLARRKGNYYVYAILDGRKRGRFSYGDSLSFSFEPFYIGKGIGYRARRHITRALNETTDTFLYRKIRSIFSEGNLPILSILCIDINSEEQAFDIECEFITTIGRTENSSGPLINHTNGGGGLSTELRSSVQVGKKASEQTKEKMRVSRQGKKHNQEWKDAISNGHQHFWNSQSKEERKQYNAYHIGKKRPKETGERISNAKKGKQVSPDALQSKRRKMIKTSIFLLSSQNLPYEEDIFDKYKQKGGTPRFVDTLLYYSSDELALLISQAYSTVKN